LKLSLLISLYPSLLPLQVLVVAQRFASGNHQAQIQVSANKERQWAALHA
jgi:hypothetical protein